MSEQYLGTFFFQDWHFVIIGVAGTPYEGGYYHGENQCCGNCSVLFCSVLLFKRPVPCHYSWLVSSVDYEVLIYLSK